MFPDVNSLALKPWSFSTYSLKKEWIKRRGGLQLPDAGFLFFCKCWVFSGRPGEKTRPHHITSHHLRLSHMRVSVVCTWSSPSTSQPPAAPSASLCIDCVPSALEPFPPWWSASSGRSAHHSAQHVLTVHVNCRNLGRLCTCIIM